MWMALPACLPDFGLAQSFEFIKIYVVLKGFYICYFIFFFFFGNLNNKRRLVMLRKKANKPTTRKKEKIKLRNPLTAVALDTSWLYNTIHNGPKHLCEPFPMRNPVLFEHMSHKKYQKYLHTKLQCKFESCRKLTINFLRIVYKYFIKLP